jgi:hypothetical protein
MLDLALSCKSKNYFLEPEKERVLVLDLQEEKFDFLAWSKEYKLLVEQAIQKYGGVLFRNSQLSSVSEFNRFVQNLYPCLLDYVYRSTPRTKLGDKIYTATEYPADRSIPLHNEFSYANAWPHRIVFFSIIPAVEGGETPIADCNHIYQHIDPFIINTFEKKGVMYVRNYREGLDLSWQEVFQSSEKKDVENYCKNNDIEYQWKSGPIELATRKTCQATISHPVTKAKIWFNQAHLFHISSLNDKTRQLFIKELGEKNIPRNSFYGDGSSIDESVLEHIRLAYEKEKIKFKWQRQDILILDNILMAHGREPYKGERKVVVAMAANESSPLDKNLSP